MKIKQGISWLLIAMVILLSGCQAIGIDVEDQLRPPKNNGEQERVRDALDVYIRENHVKGETTSYILKYPTEGDYLSSFILLDQVKPHSVISSSDTKKSSPNNEQLLENYGVAFYCMDADNAKTHINLLKKENGKWTSVADMEGDSEEVAQIDFGDLNNDGFPELFVGWNMYNTKDKRLGIYDLRDELQPLFSNETYTSLVVNDLTADGADDFLLLNINSAVKRVSARLFSWLDGQFSLRGETDLDGNILRIEQALVSALKTNVYGVYLDAYKDPHTVITELIYWENGELKAPLYDQEADLTSNTAREILLNCQDIDQDGIVEWPIGKSVSDVDSQREELWEITWQSYDIESDEIQEEFSSIVNQVDCFLIKLSENWPSDFTIEYNSESRITTFYLYDETSEKSVPFLEIQTTTSGKKSDLEEGFIYFDETESLYYALHYDDKVYEELSLTEIQYLFYAL